MRRLFSILALALTVLAVACGGSSSGSSAASSGSGGQKVTLRLAYFPNMTHAQPQVGLVRGTYAQDLGPNVNLDMSKTFNAGPTEMEALLAGAIDAAYVGPSPAVNAYLKTDGKELRVIAGATVGGASLIVRPGANITKPADFANKKVATPQLGNTQDVALRAWLKANGLNAKEQGGNVNVQPVANADALTLFKKGDLDAAWEPEPWATRLVQEAGGKVFLDERSLWPNGQFSTTVLVVRTSFLTQHPDVVQNLLKAQVETTQWIKDNPDQAKQLVNQNIAKVSGQALDQATIDAAWKEQDVTNDPIAPSVQKGATEAQQLGFIEGKSDISGMFSLDLLNKVLNDEKQPQVSSKG